MLAYFSWHRVGVETNKLELANSVAGEGVLNEVEAQRGLDGL